MGRKGGSGGKKAKGGGQQQQQKKKPHNKNGDKKNGGGGRKGKDDDIDPEMKYQLEEIGLALKEITGDGNCLFRALADQLYGDPDSYHRRLRNETVDFMRRNKSDFEPFFVVGEDGQSFERHLDLLDEDGTFAGNDAIVAFARRYEVVVVIHQLNEPLWKVGEEVGESSSASAAAAKSKRGKKRRKQLHVSYHNGDHYNSVRRLGDTESQGKPANVCVVQMTVDGLTRETSQDVEEEEEEDDLASDYENVPDPETVRQLVQEVRNRTGVTDNGRIQSCLQENDFNLEPTVGVLVKEVAVATARKARSSLWKDGGTGERIFGGNVADSAVQQRPKATAAASSSKAKRKPGRHSRRKNGRGGSDSNSQDSDDDSATAVVASNLATLSI